MHYHHPNNTFIHALLTAVLVCVGHFYSFESNAQGFEHVDPPYWWTGMPSDTLEILIHETNIGHVELKIETPQGVEWIENKRFENPNYQLIKVSIGEKAKPGTIHISGKAKGKKYKHDYPIEARDANPLGLNGSDVVYLITPDRFANGDVKNDALDGFHQNTVDRDEPYERHGGDIQGILDHLDYIEELNMTALWINPLLENDQPHESYHGYAITNSFEIDQRFGTNELYRKLIDELHSRDMKIIQDVIYNHIGNEHYLYSDMPDSTWFHFWPEFQRTNYRAPSLMDPYASEHDRSIMTDGWFDKHMPDLNQQNPHVARYFIQQTIWWIEAFHIDALRIDTYAYPDQGFMRTWGQELKAAFPDLFLFAETWVHGPTVQGWFVGNALAPAPNYIDGVTDFQVYYAINDALTRDQGWAEGLSRLYYTLSADYIYEEPNDLVTFLDNHDLARFLGYVNGDLNKMKIGLGWLYTLRGIPSVYYGTEILMKETDGHGKIREDFPGGWAADSLNKSTPTMRSSSENEIFDCIKSLGQLRKESTAIQNGNTTQFVPVDDVYVYFRYDENETYMIITNAGKKEREVKMDRFEEQLKGQKTGTLLNGSSVEWTDVMTLPPFTQHILRIR